MHVPFVTTVSFADSDGVTINLQYGVAAPSEHEAEWVESAFAPSSVPPTSVFSDAPRNEPSS